MSSNQNLNIRIFLIKKLFIKRVIQAFKQDKYNIKDLSFKDLTYFIGLVADHQIEDIQLGD